MESLNLFIENIYKDLNVSLSNIERKTINKIQTSQEIVAAYYESLLALKSFVSQYTFKSEQEEIHFFKQVKPSLLGELLYHNKIIEIEINIPPGTDEDVINYYNCHIQHITRFFKKHKDFYQYHRLNSTANDNFYFLRKNNNTVDTIDPTFLNLDADFSTKYDVVIAQIQAYDRLEFYIKEKINLIENKTDLPKIEQLGSNEKGQFHWTDSKSALVELIYALTANKSINNGQNDVKDLALFFEQHFNISLGDIYRTYFSLKSRQSPTVLIDSLKESFLKKINNE